MGIQQPNLLANSTPKLAPLRPARYTSLRVGMAGVAGLSLAALWWRRRRPHRAALTRLYHESQRIVRRLLAAWWQLSSLQRMLVIILGVSAVAVRGWVVVHCPITDDELTSYDCYVHPGLALTASNYSLPNNHILYNLLVGMLGKLSIFKPDLLQRIPAVLISLGLLPICYLLLLQYLRFSAATLALGLFTFMPTPTFYAVAGRGYSLVLAAMVAGFFATLVLMRRGPHRLAKVIFVLSGSAGLYAVPTHVWVLVAFGLVLLLTYLRQPWRLARVKITWLAGATVGIGATAVLLYSPVGAISGWPALFQNSYVASSLRWNDFWQGLYNPYLLDAASRLWGHGRWSTAMLAGLAVLAPFGLVRVRPALRPLGWLSYVILFLPLLLMVEQRIYMPPRTLLASALCVYILLATLGQEAAQLVRLPQKRNWQVGKTISLFLGLVGYGAFHLYPETRNVQALVLRTTALRRQYAWLRARQPHRIWLDERSRALQGIYWRHMGLLAQAPLPLVVADKLPARAESQVTEYVAMARRAGEGLPPALSLPVYTDEYLVAWQLAFSKPEKY